MAFRRDNRRKNTDVELAPLQAEGNEAVGDSDGWTVQDAAPSQQRPAERLLITDDAEDGHATRLDIVDPIDQLCLLKTMAQREHDRTRWINILGTAHNAMTKITDEYLAGHQCLLALQGQDLPLFGGPLQVDEETEIIWLHTYIWTVNPGSKWHECQFRMAVSLPRQGRARTIITQFPELSDAARRMHNALEECVLHLHPLQGQSLRCAWIVAYTALRFITEQLNPAFELFDPIYGSANNNPLDERSNPSPRALSSILDRSFRLASIQRFLSSIEEISFFFVSVREINGAQHQSTNGASDMLDASRLRIQAHADLEARRLQKKIKCGQKLCKTYISQYEALAQLKISLSTSQITSRLDHGAVIAEKLAKVGVLIGGIASVLSPLGLLTSFFGMNVGEFEQGGQASLFDFWTLAIPITLLACAIFAVASIWLVTASSTRTRK